MTVSLLDSTRVLLDEVLASGVSLRLIAEGSGGTFNYEWLKKLSAGKIDDPGVSRIEALHQRLLALKADAESTNAA